MKAGFHLMSAKQIGVLVLAAALISCTPAFADTTSTPSGSTTASSTASNPAQPPLAALAARIGDLDDVLPVILGGDK